MLKRKQRLHNKKSKRLAEINVDIINISWEFAPMEHVHEIYSLR
ncbi:Transposase [Bacillus thuringiensis serovar tochigiensis BGSC 4Y1]|nr:Transposase [Bacillus thuringiensis serovar tochigiensis BGSC 4Y1]